MLEPVIRSLTVHGFRSFPAAWVELDNPTFLVGRNGSGKSNLADSFALLADAMEAPLYAAFERRGGITAVRNRSPGPGAPPKLGLAVELGPHGLPAEGQLGGRYAFVVRALRNYSFKIEREQCLVRLPDGRRHWFERRNGKFETNVGGLDPALEPTALALPVVGGDARFAPMVQQLAAMRVHAIEPGRLREMQDPDAGTRLRRDGSNCASVLREIARRSQEDLERIGEILESVVPNTRRVAVKPQGNKLTLEFTQKWEGDGRGIKFPAFNMSDGTLRVLGLLAAVFQQPTPSLVVLEEPELTVHPGAIGAVLDLVRHASRTMQVVVTTHSPEVLDAEWLSDRNLRIAEWQSGTSRIAEVSETTRRALREHVMGAGELLRSNALEAARSPLFQDSLDQVNLFEMFGTA